MDKEFYKTTVITPDEDTLIFLSLEDISESSKVRRRFGLKSVGQSKKATELTPEENHIAYYYGEEYGVTPTVKFSFECVEQFCK